MNENLNPSYYAILTAEVRYDRNISDKAKLIYAELTALSNQFGYAWPSNKYLADLYNVSELTITRLINQLKKYKYIQVVYENTSSGTKRVIIITKKPPIKNDSRVVEPPIKNDSHPPIKNDSRFIINNTRNEYYKNLSNRESINNVVNSPNDKSKKTLSHKINIDLELISSLVQKHNLENTNPETVYNHLFIEDFKNKSGTLINTEKKLLLYLQNWNQREWKNPNKKENIKQDWVPSWVDDYMKELEEAEDN